jgi:type I restriction enzyme, S subunit
MINMGEIFANGRIGDIDMQLVPLVESERKNYLLQKNDLLFARASLAEGAGKCCIFVGSEETTFESHVIRVRLNPRLADSRFYYYYFNSSGGKNLIETIVEKTAASGIRASDLAKLVVPYRTMSVQTRIADLFELMDRKIELNHQMNKILESVTQALFKHWFIGFEFPNEEGKPYKSSGGAMTYNDELSMDLPIGWKVGSILEFADILSGGTPRTEVAGFWRGEIPWVSAKDVTANHGSFILATERTITQSGVDHSNAKLLPKYTTVVTARGSVGSYCILARDMTINQTNYGLKAKSCTGDFFVFFSISNLVSQMKQRSYGTIFDTITTSTFEEMKVPIPPSQTIMAFESRIENLMMKDLANLEECRILASLRDSLLPRLMSGKIRVPIQRG